MIGKEAREQMLEPTGRLPDLLVAAIGGGSNAIGLFHPFLDDPDGRRCSASKRPGHGSTPASMPPAWPAARPGILHGNKTYLLQDEDGQITEGALDQRRASTIPASARSIAWLHEIGRVEYTPVTDTEALDAFQLLLPHRRHHPRAGTDPRHRRGGRRSRRRCRRTQIIVVNLCGRGDKDIFTVADALGVKL